MDKEEEQDEFEYLMEMPPALRELWVRESIKQEIAIQQTPWWMPWVRNTTVFLTDLALWFILGAVVTGGIWLLTFLFISIKTMLS